VAFLIREKLAGGAEVPPRNANRRRSIRKVRVLGTQVTLPLSADLRRSDSKIRREAAVHDGKREFHKES
jgi:hypothetical protein